MSESTPAGPELDAMIAREVFGISVLGMAYAWAPEGDWSVQTHQDGAEMYGVLRPVYLKGQHCCQCAREEEPSLLESFPREVFGHRSLCLDVVEEYSTCIAGAWRVVEKMLAGKWDYESRSLINDRYRFQFMWLEDFDICISNGVGHVSGGGDPFQWIADAETMPLAICRAALKAIANRKAVPA